MFQLINVKSGRLGKKVVAASALTEGALVMRFTGVHMSYDEVKEKRNESFGLQVDLNSYVFLHEPACYINHSCDPNCGVNGSLDLVALKNIAPGSELTYDYSTTMLEGDWTMRCICGTSICRGIVTDFPKLPEKTKAYYISRNIVQSYILRTLQDEHQ